MRLDANLSMLYPGLTLESRMVRAAHDGFRAVEILFPYDLGPAALAAQLSRHGLELVLINTPLGAHQEKGVACLPGHEAEFRQGLEHALEVCRHTGCRSIHVMAGSPPRGASIAACRATLVDNLRHALCIAAPAGVTLTLEALNRQDVPGYLYYLPAQVMDVIDAVGHDGVRLQYDFYHCQREGLDLVHTLRDVLTYVHHVQFASTPHRHEPDLCDPAVRDALLLLRASGYAGWIGCEYNPKDDTSVGLAWRAAYDALVASDP